MTTATALKQETAPEFREPPLPASSAFSFDSLVIWGDVYAAAFKEWRKEFYFFRRANPLPAQPLDERWTSPRKINQGAVTRTVSKNVVEIDGEKIYTGLPRLPRYLQKYNDTEWSGKNPKPDALLLELYRQFIAASYHGLVLGGENNFSDIRHVGYITSKCAREDIVNVSSRDVVQRDGRFATAKIKLLKHAKKPDTSKKERDEIASVLNWLKNTKDIADMQTAKSAVIALAVRLVGEWKSRKEKNGEEHYAPEDYMADSRYRDEESLVMALDAGYSFIEERFIKKGKRKNMLPTWEWGFDENKGFVKTKLKKGA